MIKMNPFLLRERNGFMDLMRVFSLIRYHMKKIIPFVLSLFLSASLYSQTTFTITGKVLDSATKQPLQAASVFAQNTTVGTATDTDGSFKLQLPNGGYDLVVTFTGYQTETRRISTSDAGDKSIVIEVKQKEKEMQDVVIKATYEVADGWEKYGDFFLDQFIGKTANGKQCVITNKEVLKFYYYKRKNRLKILATAPVEIVNEALGYTIKYTLDSFTHEYNTQLSQYTGYPLFQEMTPSNDDQKQIWAANRAKAYNGSILHFMRSLYQKRLREEGFEIQFIVTANEKELSMPVKDFYGALNYSKDDSMQTVEVWPNQPEVAVIYKKEAPEAGYQSENPDESAKFQASVFSFLPKQSIVIERNGYYFDQTDFTIRQYLSWEKMADMLPYDYNGQ